MAAVAIAQKMSPEVSRVSRESRGLIASALKRMLKDASWKKALEDADGRPELAQRLYQVVMEIHEKHAATLSRMCETLQPTETTAYPQFVGVTDELFKDGINWGRIATLLAFGVHLGLYFQDHGMPEMVPSVIGWLQRLAENDLLVWIQKQGGWVREPALLQISFITITTRKNLVSSCDVKLHLATHRPSFAF